MANNRMPRKGGPRGFAGGQKVDGKAFARLMRMLFHDYPGKLTAVVICITLNAVITPATATNQKVIWSVDCGKDIATIDRHGRLKAGKGFTAPVTITVTAVSAENSAITATRTVQILPPVTTVAISAPRNYIDVDGGFHIQRL